MNEDFENFVKALPELDAKLKTLFKAIKAEIIVEDDNVTIEVDEGKIKELIAKLEILLKNKNPKARDVIAELEKAGYKNDDFERLKRAVSRYDFKSAIAIKLN